MFDSNVLVDFASLLELKTSTNKAVNMFGNNTTDTLQGHLTTVILYTYCSTNIEIILCAALLITVLLGFSGFNPLNMISETHAILNIIVSNSKRNLSR